MRRRCMVEQVLASSSLSLAILWVGGQGSRDDSREVF